MLLSRNMTAVAYHAHFLPQKSICPMSQTSRTSGWRRQNSQSTSDLLNVSDNGNFGEFFYLEMVVNSRVKHYKCNEHSKDEPVVSKVLAQVIEFRAWSRGGMSEATYPGTSPSMLYDQGKLMMARQIYSEKSSAAVCKWKQTRQHFNEKRVGMVEQVTRQAADILPTACAVLDARICFAVNLFLHKLRAGFRVGFDRGHNN